MQACPRLRGKALSTYTRYHLARILAAFVFIGVSLVKLDGAKMASSCSRAGLANMVTTQHDKHIISCSVYFVQGQLGVCARFLVLIFITVSSFALTYPKEHAV